MSSEGPNNHGEKSIVFEQKPLGIYLKALSTGKGAYCNGTTEQSCRHRWVKGWEISKVLNENVRDLPHKEVLMKIKAAQTPIEITFRPYRRIRRRFSRQPSESASLESKVNAASLPADSNTIKISNTQSPVVNIQQKCAPESSIKSAELPPKSSKSKPQEVPPPFPPNIQTLQATKISAPSDPLLKPIPPDGSKTDASKGGGTTTPQPPMVPFTLPAGLPSPDQVAALTSKLKRSKVTQAVGAPHKSPSGQHVVPPPPAPPKRLGVQSIYQSGQAALPSSQIQYLMYPGQPPPPPTPRPAHYPPVRAPFVPPQSQNLSGRIHSLPPRANFLPPYTIPPTATYVKPPPVPPPSQITQLPFCPPNRSIPSPFPALQPTYSFQQTGPLTPPPQPPPPPQKSTKVLSKVSLLPEEGQPVKKQSHQVNSKPKDYRFTPSSTLQSPPFPPYRPKHEKKEERLNSSVSKDAKKVAIETSKKIQKQKALPLLLDKRKVERRRPSLETESKNVVADKWKKTTNAQG